MKKLTLNLEQLDVQTFTAGGSGEGRGTVRAHSTFLPRCMPEKDTQDFMNCESGYTQMVTDCGLQASLCGCSEGAQTCDYSYCYDTCHDYQNTCGRYCL